MRVRTGQEFSPVAEFTSGFSGLMFDPSNRMYFNDGNRVWLYQLRGMLPFRPACPARFLFLLAVRNMRRRRRRGKLNRAEHHTHMLVIELRQGDVALPHDAGMVPVSEYVVPPFTYEDELQ